MSVNISLFSAFLIMASLSLSTVIPLDILFTAFHSPLIKESHLFVDASSALESVYCQSPSDLRGHGNTQDSSWQASGHVMWWCDVHFMLNTRESWVERTIMATYSLLVSITHSLRMVWATSSGLSGLWLNSWHPPPSIPTCIQFSALVTNLMQYGKANIIHPKRDWGTQHSTIAPKIHPITGPPSLGRRLWAAPQSRHTQYKSLRTWILAILFILKTLRMLSELSKDREQGRMLKEVLAKQGVGSGHADSSNSIGSRVSKSQQRACIEMCRI